MSARHFPFLAHGTRYFRDDYRDMVRNVRVRHPNGAVSLLGDVPLRDLDDRIFAATRDYRLAELVLW